MRILLSLLSPPVVGDLSKAINLGLAIVPSSVKRARLAATTRKLLRVRRYCLSCDGFRGDRSRRFDFCSRRHDRGWSAVSTRAIAQGEGRSGREAGAITSHEIVLGLGDVARAPEAEKKALLTRLEMDQRVRINQALAELRLQEKHEVVREAKALDLELVRLTRLVEQKMWSPEDWRGERDGLDVLVKAYETTGREALGYPPLD